MAARPSNGDEESAMVFFRIIMPSNIQEKKIRLPKKFARAYGRTLSTRHPAELCLPNGAVWKVDIIKGRGRVSQDLWLKRGWSEFMEGNSVEQGFFLTFEYDGGSRFEVGIFDKTTTEILYPPLPGAEREPPSPTVQGVGLKWNAMSDELSARGIQVTKKFYSSFFLEMSAESKKAMGEAIASKVDDFPSFIVIIQPPKHLNKVYFITVPFEFASLHMEERCARVNLKVPGARAGGFEMLVEETNGTVRIRGDDWIVFYEWNMLKRGDVCLFQLVESRSSEVAQFQVSIFRA